MPGLEVAVEDCRATSELVSRHTPHKLAGGKEIQILH